jgi:hypothetical protein
MLCLAASPERALPEFSNKVAERVERATVRRHGVVIEVAVDDLLCQIAPNSGKAAKRRKMTRTATKPKSRGVNTSITAFSHSLDPERSRALTGVG